MLSDMPWDEGYAVECMLWDVCCVILLTLEGQFTTSVCTHCMWDYIDAKVRTIVCGFSQPFSVMTNKLHCDAMLHRCQHHGVLNLFNDGRLHRAQELRCNT